MYISHRQSYIHLHASPRSSPNVGGVPKCGEEIGDPNNNDGVSPSPQLRCTSHGNLINIPTLPSSRQLKYARPSAPRGVQHSPDRPIICLRLYLLHLTISAIAFSPRPFSSSSCIKPLFLLPIPVHKYLLLLKCCFCLKPQVTPVSYLPA